MIGSLKTLDPKDAWKPASKNQWNLKWAAHLYRRAAFGFPPSNTREGLTSSDLLQRSLKVGMGESIEELLVGLPDQGEFNAMMDDMGLRIARSADSESNDAATLQTWWLYRMRYSRHPLLERLTLFWHNHFATSVVKVQKLTLMFQQNWLIRKHAIGSFRAMLTEIGRDPAMLIWLDSTSNVKGRPNENYAREVMELFTLGVGNYSERDIREAARAFTGWGVNRGKFHVDAAKHDDGPKTVLGRTGKWDGDDVAKILLDQPATARFLVRKLYRQFVSESESPPDRLLEPLVAQFRKSDYDITACLRTMLQSRLFFSEHAYRRRVKSPIEYVIGLLTSFNAASPSQGVVSELDSVGQTLFSPPNVKGWDGGKAWLNAVTLVARHNLAWRFVGGGNYRFHKKIQPERLLEKHAGKDASKQTDYLLNLLLQGDVDETTRKQLVAFAVAAEPNKKARDARLRELVHTILLLPEYQMA